MNASCLVFLMASTVAQPPSNLPPIVKEYTQATTFYYKSPDPTVGPKLLKTLLQKENIEHPFFGRSPQVLMLIAAQLGDIANGHPKIVREYEAAFAEAATPGKRVILRALKNSGDKDTLKQLETWSADKRFAELKTELDDLKKDLENPKRKHVRDLPAKEPLDLDFLWVNFFATGEYAPVTRILDVFELPDAPENATLKRVAQWSFTSNLQQHPKLVELVQKNVKERGEASRTVIETALRSLPVDNKPVVGKWVSQDGQACPLILNKDGTVEYGFVKEMGNWVMAKGNYTFNGEGKVTIRVTSGGAVLTAHFTLKEGVLVAPRGPNPLVTWKKE